MRPGVNRLDDRWQFTLWAPFAEQVELVFVESGQPCGLERGKHGYWHTTLQSLPSTTYWYRLNGNILRADPASACQPEGVHGPSHIVDHRHFHWSKTSGAPVSLEEYIIYELHIGTFTPDGTFDAAANYLQALKDIGITAVEVMPVGQFPGSRNWGYDGVFPYAVQNSYGGPDAFKRFIDTAHQLGLAVILDVVYNHLGPEGNHLQDFGPYFTDHYLTPWGQAINFDRAYSDPVRSYFIENAVYWLDAFHIDALRLDALHAVFDMSAKHFIRELAERVQEYAKQHRRAVYLIGESDLNDVRLIQPISEGGYGLDAQWSDDFHHALHTLLTGEDFGYYQDFGSTADLAKAIREGFVYDWKYSPFRKRRHGSSAAGRPASQLVVCTQNHDQIGNRMRGDRLSRLVDFERLKLAAGVLLLSPYIPLLFMGDEYGEDNPFLYFISMGDPDLVAAVRTGRAEEFQGFQWTGQCPDPQAAETFEQSKLQWDKRHQNRHKVLLHFYEHLIRLRKQQHRFVDRTRLSAGAIDAPAMVFWHRQWDEKQWLTLANFSNESQPFVCPVDMPGGFKILDSADQCWLGPGASMPSELLTTARLHMPPASICLYETQQNP